MNIMLQSMPESETKIYGAGSAYVGCEACDLGLLHLRCRKVEGECSTLSHKLFAASFCIYSFATKQWL